MPRPYITLTHEQYTQLLQLLNTAASINRDYLNTFSTAQRRNNPTDNYLERFRNGAAMIERLSTDACEREHVSPTVSVGDDMAAETKQKLQTPHMCDWCGKVHAPMAHCHSWDRVKGSNV